MSWTSLDRLKIPQELAAIIKSDKVPLKDYLVIDVRDDDYAGGNIPKGQNWPSRNFMWKADELVEKTKDVQMVVFHCTFSQERWVSQFWKCNITCAEEHANYLMWLEDQKLPA